MKRVQEMLQAQFNRLCKNGILFRSTVTGREVWIAYLKFRKKMKNNYLRLAAMLMMACVLWSCEAAQPDRKDAVAGNYDTEVYFKKICIGKHEYYVVYATCDARPGHTVEKCNNPHCFLLHSPDCPCRGEESAVSMVTDDNVGESTDPFDW